MFITNGDEVINLNLVRFVQCFEENFTIRLNINEHQFALLRFNDEYPYSETKKEILEMLEGTSSSWKPIDKNMMVRIDKLQYANAVGSELRMFFDTGVVKTTHKHVYRPMQALADVTRSICFEEY